MHVSCPSCAAQNDAEQRFCGSCGAALTRTCRACGEANPPGFSFCGSCGASMKDEAAPDHAGERRWITVLFADLSGFTKLSEPMDPEDVRTLVDRCMAKMGDIVVRYGGFVERVIGDELMALFGAPIAHEDDPERAVRAAIEIQRCAVDHADDFGGLPVRVGVNTGEMMFAPVGPEGARQFTVMGDAVNTASRLRDAAPRGGVLVGEETHRATERAIRYQTVEPFRAKGKEQPVSAWLALEATATHTPRPLSEVHMVGRDPELDLLRRIWERVVSECRPHLVTVVGAPGIGKTRLTRELATAVDGSGGRVVSGRSLPYGERTGYGAFAQQVRQHAGIYDTDAAPEARAKLDRAVPDAETAGHLALLIGIEESGAADRGPLFHSARRFVESVGSAQPTMFVFEDIHWADATLFDLIESLAAKTRGVPVLFLTLARPELVDSRPAWGGGIASFTSLPLDPLSDEHARELGSLLLPRLPEAGSVLKLAEISGGNPLFMEELAASVSETAADSIGKLPTNVKAIIAARLDALPGAERQALLDASVVGKVFWRGAIERGSRGIDEILDSLETRDLVRREPVSSLEGDQQYVFKHILIREVAYATLPKAARRERHAAVARFLEGAAGESASLLAHHWLQAGEIERGLEYLLRAADLARRAWASGEAVKLYEEALGLLPSDDGERRTDLQLRRALAIAESGDLQRAVAELELLLPSLAGTQLCEALHARAWAAFWLVDAAGTIRFGHLLAEAAESAGLEEYSVLAVAILSQAASIEGKLRESIELSEVAFGRWPAGRRPAERSILLGFQGIVYYWIGNYDRASVLLDEAWRSGQEVHSLTGFLQNAPALNMALAGLGRHEEAIAHGEWTLARARELELVPRWTARSLNMLAGVLYEVLDTERARLMNEEAIELGNRAAFPTAAVQARTDMLFASIASGDVDTAQLAWTAAWEELGKLSGWHEWLVRGRLLQAKAEMLLTQGRFENAAEAAAESIDYHRSYPRLKYETAARLVLAEAAGARGLHEEAVEQLKIALHSSQQLGHPPSIWRAAASLARSRYRAGDDAGAERYAGLARETVQRFASTLNAPRRSAFLDSRAVADTLALR